MGLAPFIAVPSRPAPLVAQAWLQLVQAQVEALLAELLVPPDEARIDERWTEALGRVREYVLRPVPRIRPALLLAGYCLTRGSMAVPAGLWRFAAGLELLRTFSAVHDEVVEGAGPRRGGQAMHHLLGAGRLGQDLAVVVGDSLFARALETMLGAELPGAGQASQYFLRMCRYAAAGRYVDLRGEGGPSGPSGMLQALRGARLRAVCQGFSGSLVCGAMLAGADGALRLRLARVGCGVELAWQLRDELFGLFGGARGAEGAARCDFTLGRRTFPVAAAGARSRPEARQELEALWALPLERKDDAARARARWLVEEAGGRVATERLVARASRGSVRALAMLPDPNGLRELLRALIGQWIQRMN